MTCIVGLAFEGKLYMGGDSAGVAGYMMTLAAHPKVFRNGDFLIGYTSSFRMGQLLEYSFDPPLRHPVTPVMRYMTTDFIDGVRNCFRQGGFTTKENDAEMGGHFLVGYEGKLYRVEAGYLVFESAYGFDAVGCGGDVAVGAMHANGHLSPEERILNALSISEKCSANVRAPFHILTAE